MAGLIDNPLYQLTGLDKSGPMSTLQALSASRGQGAAGMTPNGMGMGNVPMGTPKEFRKPTDSVPMPDMSPPDVSTAHDEGSQRAERDAKGFRNGAPKAGGPGGGSADIMGFSPKILDLARAMAPNSDDNHMALARAGIGMAQAGSHGSDFLSALTAGAGTGLDFLQQQRASRAEMAFKQNQQDNENQYRSASLAQTGKYQDAQVAHQAATLEQTGKYQNDETANRAAQLKIQQDAAVLVANGWPQAQALAKAQENQHNAQAEAERQRGGLYAAQADALGGAGNGIPKDIWKNAQTQASKAIAQGGVYLNPEEYATQLNTRSLAIAKDSMNSRGIDTSKVAAFGPPPAAAAPGAPAAPPPAPKAAWVGGTFGVAENTGTSSQPLMQNAVVMVPGNQLETMMQRGSLGAIDLGATRNMAETRLNELTNEFTNLQKAGGRAVADQVKSLRGMMPKQGVLVSAPENFDRLHEMWNTTHDDFTHDARMANDPNVPKAQREIAAKRAPVEARILNLIGGDKDASEFKRFDGPGGPAKSAAPEARGYTIQNGFKYDSATGQPIGRVETP